MLKSICQVTIISLILPIVILNQNDYEYNDYSDDYYRPPPQTYKNRRYKITQFKAAAKTNPRANRVGIVDSVLGLIGGGKCLIKCVLRIIKNCDRTIECIWDCFLPQQPLNFPKPKNDDSDIRLLSVDDHTLDLTPHDVANIFSCLMQCLMRYLPRNLQTLFSWLSCSITQCICFGPNWKPKK